MAILAIRPLVVALLVVLLPVDVAAQGRATAAGPGARATEGVPAWAGAIDTFRLRLRADVAADDVGGITAAVVVGDRMIWAEGFGWADRGRRIPAGVETIYRVGSISKSFTAVAMMQLADQGSLSLDMAVARVLPQANGFAQPRAGGRPVTFRHLASHTAGLVREPDLDGAAAGPIEEWERKVLASIPATRFDTIPGARYAYSNIGFGVLGLAISRAGSTEFRTLVTRGIFDRLGMTQSTFVVPHDDLRHLAVGYDNGRDGRIDRERPAVEHRGRGYKVPNGGIYSTLGDLARFIAGMTGAAGDALLPLESRLEMMRQQAAVSDSAGYGLGFELRTGSDGRWYVGHGGSVAGYTAHIVFEPESGVGVILLRNYGTGRTNLRQASRRLAEEIVLRSAMAK
ncbi:MAG TPA: serine hydrolase domain-containing protein [Gemmatimonadaceae bacterium]|nr:serine hydrolase domain-containing protein [Gemmatimonadaceae bacterium]